MASTRFEKQIQARFPAAVEAGDSIDSRVVSIVLAFSLCFSPLSTMVRPL